MSLAGGVTAAVEGFQDRTIVSLPVGVALNALGVATTTTGEVLFTSTILLDLSEFASQVGVLGGVFDGATSSLFVRGGDFVGIPPWVWALAVGWSGVLVGTGVRLYRTRRSWMRKYRDDQPQR